MKEATQLDGPEVRELQRWQTMAYLFMSSRGLMSAFDEWVRVRRGSLQIISEVDQQMSSDR